MPAPGTTGLTVTFGRTTGGATPAVDGGISKTLGKPAGTTVGTVAELTEVATVTICDTDGALLEDGGEALDLPSAAAFFAALWAARRACISSRLIDATFCFLAGGGEREVLADDTAGLEVYEVIESGIENFSLIFASCACTASSGIPSSPKISISALSRLYNT
jgi:hypothetical protein